MDETRFDRWTRRQLGRATGGVVTVLLGLGAGGDVNAKNKHRARCRKPAQSCRSSGKKQRCCRGLQCEVFGMSRERHCCQPVRSHCSSALQCCSPFDCQEINFVSGTHCCGGLDLAPCKGEGADSDCCKGFLCVNNVCKPQL